MEVKNVYVGNSHTQELKQKVKPVRANEKKSYIIAKRLVDIVGSLIGLILLSPLFLLLFVLMKISEPRGTFFYAQDRIGKDKKTFKMYKIRSMCMDADEKLAELMKHNEIEGAMFKMKDDPRITKIGKFIRKYSIDELPQLWNVLKGDMTLVGPRPPLPREVNSYTNHDLQRLVVKPGCTGLWQISGRNDVGFKEMVDLDIIYIHNQSMIFDLKIMIKTVVVILKPNGAY